MKPYRARLRALADRGLRVAVDAPASSAIVVGGGSAIPLVGWCFHPKQRIVSLRVVADGVPTRALAHSLPRPDVYAALHPDGDPDGRSYASGFSAVVPLPGVTRERPLEIELVARLARGNIARCKLAEPTLTLLARPGRTADPTGARIAICMATHDPPAELFARQIDSIRTQTRTDWCCLISDDRSSPRSFDRMVGLLEGDDRFVLDRSPIQRGFYENFERALSLVGPDAQFVALADQDDRWYPDKLEGLLDALGSDAALAYSDCHVVSSDGRRLSDTFFAQRANNFTDLERMLVGNTVTGAASLFRAELLDDLLPFPPRVGASYHDHWLAVVALALGRLAYVDRPLYEYVQHSGSALGHPAAEPVSARAETRAPWMARSRFAFQHDLMQVTTRARALDQRLGARLAADKARAVDRLVSLSSSPRAASHLALRAIASGRTTSPTLGAERDLLSALVWRSLMTDAGRRRSRIQDLRFSSALDPQPSRSVDLADLPALPWLTRAIAPLTLELSNAQPERVNVLVPAGQKSDPLARPGADHALAVALARHGAHVRVIGCDGPPPAIGDRVETVDASNRAAALPASSRDLFVATNWTTAHVAHAATRALGRDRFLYLIDDFAPLGFPAGGVAVQARESYRLPHFALFCGESVRTYFRDHRHGVFAGDQAAGEPLSASFEEAVRAVGPPAISELARRATRRLLLYAPPAGLAGPAGPAGPAGQGMLDLGLLALARCLRLGHLGEWELNSLGSRSEPGSVLLAPEVELTRVACEAEHEYAELLRAHDVGLALLPTPRVGAVPMEMAAAGMPTVVNAVDGADRDWLARASTNLSVAGPTIVPLSDALLAAIAQAENPAARIEGAAIDWPRGWTASFNEAFLEQITTFLAAC